MGFSNLNHLTRTLLFLALSKVFLSCWNEQKYPHTRVEGIFITCAEKTNRYVPLRGCPDAPVMLTRRSGQYTPNSSVYSVTGRWPASGHDFPSLKPYWSRPDVGPQRPVTSPLSVRPRQTISPWSNELTGLCASIRSNRNQRPVNI